MTIERGTTQSLYITIKGLDLTGCDIYVTFRQGGVVLTKNTMESVAYANNATRIQLQLTQEETMAFKTGESGKVQVRWIGSDEKAHKTKTAPFDVDELLYEAVLVKED